MIYDGYSKDKVHCKLMLAKSKNLYEWQKLGPIFNESSFDNKELVNWNRSGAFISKISKYLNFLFKLNFIGSIG